jgi:hypothetical protein
MKTNVNFKGLDLDVEYDYQPEEKEVRYYSDGSGYPGCAEEFCITKVSFKGEDITDLCEVHFDGIEENIRNSQRDDF